MSVYIAIYNVFTCIYTKRSKLSVLAIYRQTVGDSTNKPSTHLGVLSLNGKMFAGRDAFTFVFIIRLRRSDWIYENCDCFPAVSCIQSLVTGSRAGIIFTQVATCLTIFETITASRVCSAIR